MCVFICVCLLGGGASKWAKNISDFRRLNRSPRKHVVVRATAGERGFKGGRGRSLSEKEEKFTQAHTYRDRDTRVRNMHS